MCPSCHLPLPLVKVLAFLTIAVVGYIAWHAMHVPLNRPETWADPDPGSPAATPVYRPIKVSPVAPGNSRHFHGRIGCELFEISVLCFQVRHKVDPLF